MLLIWTLLFFLVSLLGNSQTKSVVCSKKPFVCYDETRFYLCTADIEGNHLIQGYLRSCPAGLICDDHNQFECEEDISKEFLTEGNNYIKFGDKEGRRRIIDD